MDNWKIVNYGGVGKENLLNFFKHFAVIYVSNFPFFFVLLVVIFGNLLTTSHYFKKSFGEKFLHKWHATTGNFIVRYKLRNSEITRHFG